MYFTLMECFCLGCGGILSSPEGSIISPGYPSTYGENAECFWRIEVAHGSRIVFAFVDLDLESQPGFCPFDYVEVNFEKEVFDNKPIFSN